MNCENQVNVTPVRTVEDMKNIFEARTFVTASGDSIDYRIYIPKDNDGTKKYPLVLFLHGAGERGTDNIKQIKTGIIEPFKDPESEIYGCIVVAPQCVPGKQWVNTPGWGDCEYDSDAIPESDGLRAVHELIVSLISELPVDTDRVYSTGLSMGGYGTWDLLLRHDGIFAAAMPICGGCDTAKYRHYMNIPIWTAHGLEDATVPCDGTVRMVERISADGGKKLIFTSYPATGHRIWSQFYSDPEIFKWLLEQKLSDRT